MRRTSIAVIGGSLVGPATELLLRQRGFDNVTTYEAMPHAVSQSGGVMGLRQDTLDTLAGIGVDTGAIEALRDRNVYAYDLTREGPVVRGQSEFPGLVSSWDAIHTQLRALVDVRTGHRLVSIDSPHDGPWVLRFREQPSAEADVVLFADGRRSTGRDLLDPGRPLRYNGYVVWRGLVEPPSVSPHGFERYYDARHGRLFSVTEPIIQSGRSYWELSHNLDAAEYRQLVGGAPTDRAFMTPRTPGEDVLATILRAARYLPDRFTDMIKRSEVAGIPVNDTTMPDKAIFRHGRSVAALLGDALLPVRLQVGAGLNQGLRQAAAVADALTMRDRSGALDEWQQNTIDQLAPWVELGRSRAHRINLGLYEPVRPGRTAAPAETQWADPKWVLS